MKKEFAAILAALAMTFVIGVCILVLGLNIMINKTLENASNPTLGQDSAASQTLGISTNPAGISGTSQETISQYQAQLDQAQQELDAANLQIQQYQQLLMALAQRGVIQISANGTIYIPSSK